MSPLSSSLDKRQGRQGNSIVKGPQLHLYFFLKCVHVFGVRNCTSTFFFFFLSVCMFLSVLAIIVF